MIKPKIPAVITTGHILHHAQVGWRGAILVEVRAGLDAGLIIRMLQGKDHQSRIDLIGCQAERGTQGIYRIYQVCRGLTLGQCVQRESETGECERQDQDWIFQARITRQ